MLDDTVAPVTGNAAAQYAQVTEPAAPHAQTVDDPVAQFAEDIAAQTTRVPRKRGGLKIVLALVAVVAALGLLGAAFVYAGGLDIVNGLLGGGDDAAKLVTEKPKPAKTSAAPAAAQPAAAAAEEPAVSAQALVDMYWEQLESQEQIAKLIGGQVTEMTFGTPSVGGDVAKLPLTVTYEGGASLRGTMTLRKDAGVWYFAKISASGSADPDSHSASQGVDEAVVKTIVAQQSENQELLAGLLDGSYSTLVVDAVKPGAGTTTLDVTLSGGSSEPAAGEILFIGKASTGATRWFVTSFRETS